MARWEVTFTPNIRSDELLEQIIEIEAFKRSVLKLPIPPSFAQEIDRLNIVRQVKGTTGIEGNTLSQERVEELVRADSEGKALDKSTSIEEREVINAQRVLHYIRQLVKDTPDQPVTESLIREFHQRMTEDCEHLTNEPGRYRQHDVTAGEYHPPSHDELPKLMSDFIRFINSGEARRYGALVRAVMAHFYLISIHPFADGNGRTSRALEAYILCQSDYNVRGFYSLANFFYQHREEYITQLQDARFKHQGNLTEFVRFALHGYEQELNAIQERILEFAARRLFRDVYLEAARHKQISVRALSLLEYLTFNAADGIFLTDFRNRTHPFAASAYRKLNPKTQQRDLNQLLDANLVVVRNERLVANLDIMKQFAG